MPTIKPKDKKSDISPFQKEVLSSIRSSLPAILTDIAYNYPEFSNISNKNGNKLSNAMTVKNVSFVNHNTVFVELNLVTEFVNEIGRLNKFDWKLGIEARGNIKAFMDAKWKSSGGKNGLNITVAEEMIDFSKTYSYPSLLVYNSNLKNPLDFIVGKDERWEDVVFDLATLPHLLVAWSTGWGKSVAVTNILASLMKNRLFLKNIDFIIIDPKRVEFWPFKWLPGFDVITDLNKANHMMQWLVAEMERRYQLLEELGYKNIISYNKNGGDMVYKVCIIDEFADIMTSNKERAAEFENCIVRISQLARAVGIHLIIATQNPIAEVITSNIKANLPSRLGCKTVDSIKSNTIIDETILGEIKIKGEIYLKSDIGMKHMKSFFIDSDKGELQAFIDYYQAESLKQELAEWGITLHQNNSEEGITLHQKQSPLPSSKLLREFDIYAENNDVSMNKFGATYLFFRHFVENNGYANRNELRDIKCAEPISAQAIEDLIRTLKERRQITYNTSKKYNFLSFVPSADTMEELWKLHTTISIVFKGELHE